MQKRSVRINGHATSISLEDPFWIALRDIAVKHGKALNQLITEIDAGRGEANLSSALRVYVLAELKRQLATARPASHPATDS